MISQKFSTVDMENEDHWRVKHRIKASERRISSGITSAKTQLRLIDEHDGEINMKPSFELTSMFIEIKSDVWDIIDLCRKNLEGISLSHIEGDMTALEERFGEMEDQQEKINVLFRLISLRDELAKKACGHALSKIGVEYAVDMKVSQLQVKTFGGDLMRVLSTIQSMSRILKMVGYTKDEADMTLALHNWQQKCTRLEAELSSKSDEVDNLSSRFKIMTDGEGRHQKFFLQQREIDELKNTCEGLRHDVQKLRDEKNHLTKSLAYTNDMLTKAHSANKILKETHEKHNSALRPQVQQSVVSLQAEAVEISEIHGEIALLEGRAQKLEMEVSSSREEIEKLQHLLKVANQRNLIDLERVELLQKENCKLKKVNQIVMGAKIASDDRVSSARADIEKVRDELQIAQDTISEKTILLRRKDKEIEAMHTKMDQQVLECKNRDQIICDGRDQQQELLTELAKRDDEISNVRGLLTAYEREGMTTSAKTKMTQLEQNIQQLKNENLKLKDSMRRVARAQNG